MKTLQEELKTLDDKRRKQGQRHSIDIVLMIAIMSTMSGFIGYRAIGDFVTKYKKELIEYFKPKKGRLPSFPTVRRVLINVEQDKFALVFERWMSKYLKKVDNKWISVDGKAIRGTCQKEEDKKLAHLVSFFINDSKEVILSRKTESRSNEIPLVQEILREFPLKNLIITMDAMHCQEETLKLIKDSGNDYVVQVKKKSEEPI